MFSLAWQFVKRDFIENISYRFTFLMQSFGMFVQVGIFYFLSTLIGSAASPHLEEYGGNYFPFVMIGIVFMSFVTLVQNGIKTKIERLQTTGTLEALLVTRTKPGVLISFSMLYDLLFTITNSFIYLFICLLFFRMHFDQPNILGGVVVLMLTILSLLPIGIGSAAFILVFKKGDPINFIISNASRLLAGVWYPVAVLPLFLKKIGYFLPLTHSLEAARKTILMGEPLWAVRDHLLYLSVFTIVMLPFSLWIFSKSIERAKQTGSLAKY